MLWIYSVKEQTHPMSGKLKCFSFATFTFQAVHDYFEKGYH